MGKIALLFPGQGAQYSGMGRELYESSRAAAEVFNSAERLRPGTMEQCFSGTAQELALTENTQPCLYCVDLAAAAALREAGVRADMLAGFSLGELAALAFSGAVSYEEGFRLVCSRARLMQKATEEVEAGMLAVLRLEDETVCDLCAEFSRVYPVNFNCPGQVVVSGVKDQLEEFKARVRDAGGKIMPLKVSGGFHSPFLSEASASFEAVLEGHSILPPALPLYSNVTGLPYAGNVKSLLARQICSPVLWSKTVRGMIEVGADTFIEVGPGRVLTGLVSRISDQVRVYNVQDKESLSQTISGVERGA